MYIVQCAVPVRVCVIQSGTCRFLENEIHKTNLKLMEGETIKKKYSSILDMLRYWLHRSSLVDKFSLNLGSSRQANPQSQSII